MFLLFCFSFYFLLLWVYTHPFSAEPASSGHTSCYEIERPYACSSKATFLLFLFPFWSLLLCVFCCDTSILPYSPLLCTWTHWMWPWVGDVPLLCSHVEPLLGSAMSCLCSCWTWTFSHHFFAVFSGLLPYSHIKAFLPFSLSYALLHLYLCLFPQSFPSLLCLRGTKCGGGLQLVDESTGGCPVLSRVRRGFSVVHGCVGSWI